jgi:hypothetical protein
LCSQPDPGIHVARLRLGDGQSKPLTGVVPTSAFRPSPLLSPSEPQGNKIAPLDVKVFLDETISPRHEKTALEGAHFNLWSGFDSHSMRLEHLQALEADMAGVCLDCDVAVFLVIVL